MPGFVPVTDEMLAAAQADRAYRRELLNGHLNALILELSRLRDDPRAKEPVLAGQIARGAAMAVQLADILQKAAD
jgi:hypothetical protein